MKKFGFTIFSFIIILFFISCDDKSNSDENNAIEIKTGKVTFFNESSYHVIVHQGAFSGAVLVELNAGQYKTIDVRISDNHGVGTMFSIEYLYRITDGFDTESGDVIASGIDPNVQINMNIEENKTITIQIPQPQALEFRSAFIKILNSHNMPCEFRYMGNVFFQTGNGNIPIPPGKTGVYKLDGIPSEGKLYQNYQLFSNFVSTTIPDFTAMNGFIYNFTYNASTVVQTGQQTIIF